MTERHIFFKRNKFNARTCHCQQNHTHRSIFEAHYCDQLAILVKAKEIKSYTIEEKFSFDVNGVHITNYFADFLVVNLNGKLAVHETKGFKTDIYIIKKKLFKAIYPEIEFIEVRE